MDKTLSMDSKLGQRLNKVKKVQSRCLLFKGKEIPLISKIFIGRDNANNIIIEDILVSRVHCVIQKIKNDHYIRDLNSSNGTFINNKKIPEEKYVKLREKDIIRVGKHALTII